VHRIGRTGRAGAAGEAILFVAPRERRMLRAIEKATGQTIEAMDLPSVQDINVKRTVRFKERIRALIGKPELAEYYRLVSELEQEDDLDALQIAAALARLAQGDEPLLLDARSETVRKPRATPPPDHADRTRPARKRDRSSVAKQLDPKPLPLKDYPDLDMVRYRVAVGYQHGVKPGNIVGAIANEADIESRYIGHIEIFDDFSTVDLPAGMPKPVLQDLQKAWVCQRQLAIQPVENASKSAPKRTDKAGKSARKKPKSKSDKKTAVAKKAGDSPLKVRRPTKARKPHASD
jgi:ATP-dependent RNA helicase DeaD